jgi:alpha-amylase
VLLRNYQLSDDLSFRFTDKGWAKYPLTPQKYTHWISKALKKGETVNLFMDYETFGEHQNDGSGIFEFLEAFPKYIFDHTPIKFSHPSEIAETLQPVSAIHVPHPISWADTERDLTAWLGNNMQQNAFNKLYEFTEKIKKCKDEKILADWKYLQASDHFYYMSTKVSGDGAVHNYFNPYDSPYDAYINYMNILVDYSIRLNAAVPESKTEYEIATLAAIIYDKNVQIEQYEEEIKRLKIKKQGATNNVNLPSKKVVRIPPPENYKGSSNAADKSNK